MKLTPRQQANKERHMRKKYAKDLVQPSDNKFKKYYPKQYNKMEKTREQQELKTKQEKDSHDKFFAKYRTSVHSKEMRNVLKLEERLKYGSN